MDGAPTFRPGAGWYTPRPLRGLAGLGIDIA
jgi:hypothetical protein